MKSDGPSHAIPQHVLSSARRLKILFDAPVGALQRPLNANIEDAHVIGELPKTSAVPDRLLRLA